MNMHKYEVIEVCVWEFDNDTEGVAVEGCDEVKGHDKR
jgi:hypothetical protein